MKIKIKKFEEQALKIVNDYVIELPERQFAFEDEYGSTVNLITPSFENGELIKYDILRVCPLQYSVRNIESSSLFIFNVKDILVSHEQHTSTKIAREVLKYIKDGNPARIIDVEVVFEKLKELNELIFIKHLKDEDKKI